MIIRVLMYKAKRDGHLLDDGISAWTGVWNPGTKPYSHTEVCWGGDPETWASKGECFTSTTRGDAKGLIIRPAKTVLKHPDRWDVFEIDVCPGLLHQAKVNARASVNVNPGYGYMTILSFFWPWRFGAKPICSEAVYMFLWDCGVFPKRKRNRKPSPRRLSRWLTDLVYKAISLA